MPLFLDKTPLTVLNQRSLLNKDLSGFDELAKAAITFTASLLLLLQTCLHTLFSSISITSFVTCFRARIFPSPCLAWNVCTYTKYSLQQFQILNNDPSFLPPTMKLGKNKLKKSSKTCSKSEVSSTKCCKVCMQCIQCTAVTQYIVAAFLCL